jgi:MFS family permease
VIVQAEENVVQQARVRPRIFYGWYMVAAGMGMHLWLSVAWIYAKQIFFTPIAISFGWSRALMSGAFALERLEGSIASPIEGFLVDRFGPRRIMLLGTFITGLGVMSLSFLQNIYMFYGSVLLVSLGQSMSLGIPRTWALVQWFRRLRGRALGIGGSGAVFSGPMVIITVLLVSYLGWRAAFLVLGLSIWCINFPLVMVFRGRPGEYGYLPDGDQPEETEEEPSEEEAQSAKATTVNPGESSLGVRRALRTPAFWLLSLIFGAQTMGSNALNIHLIPYFESIGFSTAQAVSVLGAFTLLSAIGRLGGGWAFDFFNRRAVLAGIMGCQVTAFLIMANITAYWQMIPFALFWGIAFGGMIPARGVIISSYFGTGSFGSIQGLVQSVSVLGGMLGPILMGIVFDLTQSYVMAIYIIMSVAAAAIPLILLVRPPRLTENAAA